MSARPRLDKHTATGNLVDAPVTRETKAGNLVTFRLADTPRLFDRETKAWQDGETVYYDVAVKNARLGENVAGSLNKGNRVTVNGNYEAVPYVGKDGGAGLNHRIWADQVAASLEHATVEVRPNPKAEAPTHGWTPTPETAGIDTSTVDREWGLA